MEHNILPPSPYNHVCHANNGFMQNPPIQPGTSQSHIFNNDAAIVHDHNYLNFIVGAQETPEPIVLPRNLHDYQGSSSNTLPGLDDLESILGRLSLSDPFGTGFWPNDFISQPLYENSDSNGYVHDHDEMQLMMQERIYVAAAVQRVQAALRNQMRSSLLEGMRIKLVSMAKDQHKCRFLQLKIDEGSMELVDMIISGVKHHMYELMMHQFGNYLIQKIFESTSVSDEKKDLIVLSIIQDVHMLRDVCMDTNGTRVIQRMLEKIKTRLLIDEVINVMKQITVPLMKDVNGGYVIQQCVKVFPLEYQCDILFVVALNCVEIATDKRGCSVIQKCIKHALQEAIVPLVQEIIYNAALLAEDPYGNYVVQYLVEMKMVKVNGMIISELVGKYVQLSRNKHASNVVQYLLKYSEERDAMIIILELMNSPQFVSVLQDPYGNYVAQTALENSKGDLHRWILDSIVNKHRDLRSHLYGKKLLAYLEKRHKIQF